MFTDERCVRTVADLNPRDYLYAKEFANRRFGYVMPMLYGKARLCVGSLDDAMFVDQFFCFDSIESARTALEGWDGTGLPDLDRCIRFLLEIGAKAVYPNKDRIPMQ